MRWSAALSAFDEMFVGYGLNKIQWLWTLRKVGFRYVRKPSSRENLPGGVPTEPSVRRTD
eukprot:scaffold7040_cov256-Pinguiococcus_pyrenoidosus.AAC.19